MTAPATEKPRVRVAAWTADSVQNFVARVGQGTANQASATAYGPSPITRNRLQLEWAYRGSWICRQIVDAPPEDMTRAGVDIETKEPKDAEVLQKALRKTATLQKKREALQWSRLYGGAVAIILIEGQDPTTELRPDTVAKGAYKGLLPLDRWSVQPSMTDLVSDLGPSFGQPKFYSVTASALNIPRIKVHHSRVIRFEGDDLPVWQKMTENGWGLSVLEPVWDRLTAFDSTTVGIGQLVYKAHLRTLSVDGLREALASDGPALKGILKNIDMIRALQTNEGLTLLDSKDKFESHQYSFGGLADVLVQFSQQLGGAAQIPLVRLFSQSPAGFSTGDSDIRNYYDTCSSQQESRLRTPMETILEVLHWSELGRAPDADFAFTFRPLWQMSDKEKVEIGTSVANTVGTLEGAAIIDRPTALKELRQASAITGMFASITDQEIEDAENEPPEPGEDDLPPPEPGQGDEVEPGVGGADGTEPGEVPAAVKPSAGALDRAVRRARARDAGDFREGEHPRGSGGEFVSGGSGGSSKGAEVERTPHQWKMHALADHLDGMAANPQFGEIAAGAHKEAYERHRALAREVKGIGRHADAVMADVGRAGSLDVQHDNGIAEAINGGLHSDLKDKAAELRADMRDPDFVGESEHERHIDVRRKAGETAAELRAMADEHDWIGREKGDEADAHHEDMEALAAYADTVAYKLDSLLAHIKTSAEARYQTGTSGKRELVHLEHNDVAYGTSVPDDLRWEAGQQREAEAEEAEAGKHTRDARRPAQRAPQAWRDGLLRHARDAGDFTEGDHPRSQAGQFASKGSGGGGASSGTEKAFHGPADARTALAEWKASSSFKSVDDLIAAAPKNQASLGAAGDAIAKATGVTFKNPGPKTPESAKRKFEAKRYTSAGEMTDLARGGFVAKTPEQADAVVAGLREHFDVIDEGWAQTRTGYIDRKVLVRFPDSQVGELQIWEPNLLEAKGKGGGHKLYDEWRQLDPASPKAKTLEKKQRDVYAAALGRADPAWRAVLPGKSG